MLRILLLAALAAALHAQESPKTAATPQPPAKVDRALRARANQFYQDFVKGQFADAEALVAPESKNYFVAMGKEGYLSCEIKEIYYSNKFQLADVGAACMRTMMMPGFNGQAMKFSMGSQWKQEHGKWYWFVDPNAARVSPLGIKAPTAAAMAAAAAQAPQAAQAPLPRMPTQAELSNAEVALHKVKADRQSLSLKAGESGSVVFSNSALGPMSFSLLGDAPEGLEISPTQADLSANSSATVTVKASAGAGPAVLTFRVMPTGELLTLNVAIRQP